MVPTNGGYMRDPDRIKVMLRLIEDIWNCYPDLRLAQLIMNALKSNQDTYYIEDVVLEKALENYYEREIKNGS